MKEIEKLAHHLLDMINSAAELKKVSVALETLTQSKAFKSHANSIVNDEHLSDYLKINQIQILFQDIEIESFQKFFQELLEKKEFWIFSNEDFDYFDKFVRIFQMITEEVLVVNIVVAIELKPKDLIAMGQDMSKKMGKKVVIHSQVDPKIIGGAKIRIGNLVFDYSLKSKFNQFKRQWISQLSKTSEMLGRNN